MWIGINQLPVVGTFRAGHQKEWISFTNATSGRYLTFIERPLLFDAFHNDFQFSNGFSIQNNFFDKRAYGWLGVFRTNSNLTASDLGDGEYAYDGRFTFLPVWREADRVWVHLGIDGSYRNLNDNRTRFRARPLVFAGSGFQVPNIVNTGVLFSRDGQRVVNFEYASAWGPLTLTAEATFTSVGDVFTGGLPRIDGTLPAGVVRRGRYRAHGFYVEALFFLTGEHRPYRPEQPGYERIVPLEPFFLVRGPDGLLHGRGAWEIGVRYDFVDLSDAGIDGGLFDAVTLGLNWHLNPNMKVQLNYALMMRDFETANDPGRLPGTFQGLGLRCHYDL
ncbi:MAG: hypothetical protein JNM56_00790 [Planctomycetia bacterium]|nr:hypothetical protein [Planctomycetia bacterium]